MILCHRWPGAMILRHPWAGAMILRHSWAGAPDHPVLPMRPRYR